MKKTGLFTLLFVFASGANSQIVKGTGLVGVNFNFLDRSIQTDSIRTKEKTSYIGVSLGVAVDENRVFGVACMSSKESGPVSSFC